MFNTKIESLPNDCYIAGCLGLQPLYAVPRFYPILRIQQSTDCTICDCAHRLLSLDLVNLVQQNVLGCEALHKVEFRRRFNVLPRRFLDTVAVVRDALYLWADALDRLDLDGGELGIVSALEHPFFSLGDLLASSGLFFLDLLEDGFLRLVVEVVADG